MALVRAGMLCRANTPLTVWVRPRIAHLQRVTGSPEVMAWHSNNVLMSRSRPAMAWAGCPVRLWSLPGRKFSTDSDNAALVDGFQMKTFGYTDAMQLKLEKCQAKLKRSQNRRRFFWLTIVGFLGYFGVVYYINELHFKCLEGDLEAVQKIVQEKEDSVLQRGSIVCPKISGRFPVQAAASNGRVEVTKYLLDVKPDLLNIQTASGQTLLHCASEGGNINLVRYLVEEKNFDIWERDENLRLPLHTAAMHGRMAIVRYYIKQKGMDPQDYDKDGCNLLHLAAARGALDLVTYLVEKNLVSCYSLDKNGRNPKDYAEGCCPPKYETDRKAVREYFRSLKK